MARSTATVVLLVGIVAPMWLAGRADAALTDVSITPGAGPVGTDVTVSGSGCGPGLLGNPSRVTVVGATLGVSIDLAVPASGIWSTQFVVPAGALPIAHAIVVTCLQGDLVPLLYVPLTFTVVADAPPPTTTLGPAGAVTTTVTSSTLPTTTLANGSNATTTVAPSAVAPLGPPSDGDARPAVPTLSREPSDATPTQSPTSTASESALTTTTQGTTAVPNGAAVSASRVARDDRRRPLVFGALSPIGRGWLGWLVSALLFALILSGALAILWFRWLRHTRAREWWVRWMHQILHIRSHARPPT